MPTRYEGTPAEKRALNAYIKLSRASDRLWHDLQAGLVGTNVSHAHLSVLEALHFVGPMSQKVLAQKLLRSASNVTALIDALESSGFVKRTPSEIDRRVIEVSITATGSRMLMRVFPEHAGRVADLFGTLTAKEQEELARLCKKLGTRPSSRSETSPARSIRT